MTGLSGEKVHFDAANFHRNKWDLEEIVGALSNICRFGGHMPTFYSVCQHSTLCCLNVDVSECKDEKEEETLRQLALLHDFSEAFLGDVPRPLKQLPEFAFYKVMEARFMSSILKKFMGDDEFPAHMTKAVHAIDNRVLMTERRDALTDDQQSHDWGPLEDVKPLAETIYPLSPHVAYWQFFEVAGGVGIFP